MATLTIPASDMKPGDVLDGSPGGPGWTIAAVQLLSSSVLIIDFADGTAWAPTLNGMVTVHRPEQVGP